MVPMVNSRADAEAVVRDARYLPLGERSRGPLRGVLSFETDFAGYCAAANDEILVMAQIETAEAVKNLEEIAAVDGIDCLFVGPNDLASTYGVSFPQAWDAKGGDYYDAIAAVPQVARKYGKIPGIQAISPAMANECIALGYTLVGVGADAGFLWATARRVRSEVNAGT
jgi:2-keto-3-deoxy-L-rhamnonate aldolase RhmA